MAPESSVVSRKRIAFYMPSLIGHGAEKAQILLALGLVGKGYTVDLVVDKKVGPYLDQLPDSINLIELTGGSRVLAYLGLLRVEPGTAMALLRPLLKAHKPFMTLWQLNSLVHYLKAARPSVLISSQHFPNILAPWAVRIAQTGTATVVTERTTLSKSLEAKVRESGKPRRGIYRREFIERAYPRADAIVAVSDGAGDDLAATANIDRSRIQTIYNPVVSGEMQEKAAQPAGHSWLDEGDRPVILGVGRLFPAKGFDTLVDAFASLAVRHDLRLIILGEGDERTALERQVERLGLTEYVALPGWRANPYSYMARASVFVLSSLYEGLPGVLVQAMACGAPVVATDCPNGPQEILAGVTRGLVPPGDSVAMANKIEATLQQPPDRQLLRRRAADFSVDNGVARYQALIERLGGSPECADSKRSLTKGPIRAKPRLRY